MTIEYEADSDRKRKLKELKQGLEIIHDAADAEIDILAVPGLGTNPRDCWTWSSEKTKVAHNKALSSAGAEDGHNVSDRARTFNWIYDKDGLAALANKPRILLYNYASAWKGQYKVKITMRDICMYLLDCLVEIRRNGAESVRPLLIISHSMGGIVAAKALTIAKAHQEYESILTCTMGCMFFGVPFQGSNMARLATLYSTIMPGETYDTLTSFMKTDNNQSLDEVRKEFLDINQKLSPAMEITCVYETEPTAVNYTERALQNIWGSKMLEAGTRKVLELSLVLMNAGTHFVDQQSAVLQGAHSIALASGHSDLVKFESMNSQKFAPIKARLRSMAQSALMNVRRRIQGQNMLTQRYVKQVRDALQGIDMPSRYRSRVQDHDITSWLTTEPVYARWLGANSPQSPPGLSFLWLRSGPGLGKTNACLSAIKQVGSNINARLTHLSSNQQDTFLAYFLCDYTPGCHTAEDLLKSLIIQLVAQEQSLANCARLLLPSMNGTGLASTHDNTMASMTVSNLWTCLHEMMQDPVVSGMHLVVSNVHCLDIGESTNTLLQRLQEYAKAQQALQPQDQRVKWMITSRNDAIISRYLHAPAMTLLDLENEAEYGNRIKSARQRHAKKAVDQLTAIKQYDTDIRSWITRFIKRQSEDERWIDVLCILLSAKNYDGGDRSLKTWLLEVAKLKTHELVDNALDELLDRQSVRAAQLEHVLEILAVAYEPLSLRELGVFSKTTAPEELVKLVDNCSPFVLLTKDTAGLDRVAFVDEIFRERLLARGCAKSGDWLRLQHGMMAAIAFDNIRSRYAVSALGDDLLIAFDELKTVEECPYAVKYFFRHLSDECADVISDLEEQDAAFWLQYSPVRTRWLAEFQKVNAEMSKLDTDGMSAVHIAAALGAEEVVSAMIELNGKPSLTWTTGSGMTALHIAAMMGHQRVVDRLCREGASIDAGEGSVGTPLHHAALRGNTGIMRFLIDQKANVNALADEIGPVINAAIRSGTVDAVKLMLDQDVTFDLDYNLFKDPLSLSARVSEPALFKQILTTGQHKWRANKKLIDEALLSASATVASGQLERVKTLLHLDFEHSYMSQTIERAILLSAYQNRWDTVMELLRYADSETGLGLKNNIKLDVVFYLASVSRDDRLHILRWIWEFTHGALDHQILDYSLYQSSWLRKHAQAMWLISLRSTNANASSQRPEHSLDLLYDNEQTSTLDYLNLLNSAASVGDADLVAAALRKGVDVEHPTVYALQLAAMNGHVNVIKTLIRHSIDLNRRMATHDGLAFNYGTALQAACDRGHSQAVEALLKAGADPNMGGGPYSRPVLSATRRENDDILTLLMSTDVDVNVASDVDGTTPLINAATYMSADPLSRLLERGALVNARDTAGNDALIMVAGRGAKECIELLCDAGADVTYRSDERGLAIQAAGSSADPECGRLLADKMTETIRNLREQGAQLEKALHNANTRGLDLENKLESTQYALTRTEGELKIRTDELDVARAEHNFGGEFYESRGQEIESLRSQMKQVEKQRDGHKGQYEAAARRCLEYKELLEKEKAANERLRNREGYQALEDQVTALQEELTTARNSILSAGEKLKAARLEHAHQESSSASRSAEALRQSQATLEAERQRRRELEGEKLKIQEDLENLRNTHNENQRALETLLQQRSEKQAEIKMATGKLRRSSAQSKRRQSSNSPTELNGSNGNEHYNAVLTESPVMSPTNGVATPSSSQAASPFEESFTTARGKHRPDGTFGGYKADRKLKRQTTEESLFSPNIRSALRDNGSNHSGSMAEEP